MPRFCKRLTSLVSLLAFLFANGPVSAQIWHSFVPQSASPAGQHISACKCTSCKLRRTGNQKKTSAIESKLPALPIKQTPAHQYPCGPAGCCWCNAAKAPGLIMAVAIEAIEAAVPECIAAAVPSIYTSPSISGLLRPPRA